MIYCDIHTHILPGVDDGARNMEESMEMLNTAYQDGARRIFLTPHYIPGRNDYKKENLIELAGDLRKKAEKEFPELELYLGNELFYVPGAARNLRNFDFCFMADSRYALVEFATNSTYEDIYRGIREFSEARIFPIIAHYERYSCLYKNENYLKELRRLDAYFQMNGEAFGVKAKGGGFGPESEAKSSRNRGKAGAFGGGATRGLGKLFGFGKSNKSTWYLDTAEAGYLDFLGSDAHDNNYRKPGLSGAVNLLESAGACKCKWENSQAVIDNKYL